MDKETLALVAQLCTRACMIMEDVHDAALSVQKAHARDQLLLLAHFQDAAARAARLFNAARALVE